MQRVRIIAQGFVPEPPVNGPPSGCVLTRISTDCRLLGVCLDRFLCGWCGRTVRSCLSG